MEYLFNLAIILFVAKLFSVGAKKLNLPEVVGMIFAGLILGPACFSIVKETNFIDQLAEIGVILLMFEAGLETDLKQLKETGLKSTLIACAGVFVPIVFGTVLFMLFYGFGTFGSEQMIKGLFVGTIMSATSVSITVAVLKELGVLNGKVGTTITGAAIIDSLNTGDEPERSKCECWYGYSKGLLILRIIYWARYDYLSNFCLVIGSLF